MLGLCVFVSLAPLLDSARQTHFPGNEEFLGTFSMSLCRIKGKQVKLILRSEYVSLRPLNEPG